MPEQRKKIKPAVIISLAALLLLAGYIVFNYKQVKRDFLDGVNDGKAQRAHQDSAGGK